METDFNFAAECTFEAGCRANNVGIPPPAGQLQVGLTVCLAPSHKPRAPTVTLTARHPRNEDTLERIGKLLRHTQVSLPHPPTPGRRGRGRTRNRLSKHPPDPSAVNHPTA
ncbi:hypothetical protein EVAR_9828_1 [Eumeta japonica]|uniref:Uncharacterized protein n=1 Tax=Eumeta variegata TaxID=151549 RepID=A0A4C1U5I3_EUMVA|nr:hypothetical protein EVAR_9828_1 [Eumeta japonica]